MLTKVEFTKPEVGKPFAHLIPVKSIKKHRPEYVKHILVSDDSKSYEKNQPGAEIEVYDVEMLKMFMPTSEINKILADNVSFFTVNPVIKPFMPTPKLEVGDKVRMRKPTLYGETEGVVEEVVMVLKALDTFMYNQYGIEAFDEGGLVQDSSNIDTICLPYEYDGVYLKIDYSGTGISSPGATDGKSIRVYKVHSHHVSVRTPKMYTQYSEKNVTKIETKKSDTCSKCGGTDEYCSNCGSKIK